MFFMTEKTYKIVAINIGKTGSDSRLLYDEFIKVHGQQKFSSLMRQMFVACFSDNIKLSVWKQRKLVSDYKLLSLRIGRLSMRRDRVRQSLRDMRIDPDDVIAHSVASYD